MHACPSSLSSKRPLGLLPLPGQPSCAHESPGPGKGVGGSANPSPSVETKYKDSIFPLVDNQRHCLLQRAMLPEDATRLYTLSSGL